MSFLSLESIYLDRKAEIDSLLIEEVTIRNKYLDFTNVFSEPQVLILPELTKLNQYTIELQIDEQLSYWPIYSLWPVELKTLKTYIKTNLANGFI